MFGCTRGCARAKALALQLSLVLVATALHAQAPVGQTSLSGRVIAEATGQPVRRAYVIIHGPGTKTTRVTMSDGDGKFTFEGLPNDRYRVGASKRPLLSAATDVTGAEVVISLPTGAVVTGTVIDSLGRPEPGLELTLSGSALAAPLQATTNHHGEYRFFSLPPGEYTVALVRHDAERRSVVVGPADQRLVPPLSVELPATPVTPGPQPPTGGNAVVAGVVTDMRTGEPLANAPVVNRSVRRRALTDANGRFRFDSLPAATWDFLVDGAGFMPITAAVVPLASDSSQVTDVVLVAGRTGGIAGVVRDEAGDPVVNMPVVASPRRVLGSQVAYMGGQAARTDDRGAFEIGNLRPGDYLLCACAGEPLAIDPLLLRQLGPTAPGADAVSQLIDDTVQTFAPAFYPGTSRASDSLIVSVDYGDDRTGMDITMAGVTPVGVSGQLTGSDGLPASGMQVFLTQDGDLPGAIGISGTAPVTVGANGRFGFSGLAPGRYALGAIPAEQRARTPQAYAEFTLSDRDLDDLTVAVSHGFPVKGRIDFSGRGMRPTPAELEKSRVSLAPAELSMRTLLGVGNSGTVGYGAALDTKGQFVIEHVPAGRYVVMASVPDSAWRSVQRLTAADAITTDDTITIGREGESALLVTMTDTAATTVTGTVTIDLTRYESARFIRVNVFPTDQATWLEPERHATRFGWTSIKSDGSFKLENLLPGNYYVARGSSLDAEMTRSALERWSKTAERVRLKAGETTVVTLKR